MTGLKKESELPLFTGGESALQLRAFDPGGAALAKNGRLDLTDSDTAFFLAGRLGSHWIDAAWFGDIGQGGDDTTALLDAIASAEAEGKVLRIGPGSYRTNQLLLATDAVKIILDGVTFIPEQVNVTCLRIAASHCRILGYPSFANPDNYSGCSAVRITPESETQTTTEVHQNYNVVELGKISGFDEALVMQTGPRVSGADSGCWYNTIRGGRTEYCKRSIWMKNPPNTASGVNRNRFYGFSIGFGCNTGIQIDAGGTNMFYGCSAEGVTSGTSPNATPTAIKIANTGTTAGANDSNQFFGFICEANARDVENNNPMTEIYGGVFGAGKVTGVAPKFFLGNDPAQQPFILPGMKYGEGLSGYPNGYWGMSKEIADENHQAQAYALSTGIMSNAAAIANGASRYQKLSKWVRWSIRVQFQASVAGNSFQVAPPVAPHANYTALAAFNPYVAVLVNDGTGVKPAEAGFTSAGQFYVNPPAGSTWNTGGVNNTLMATIQYEAA